MALGPPEASRRALLTSTGTAGTGVTLTLVPPLAPGESATPKKYHGMPLLEATERHLVSRFSYGITPQLASQVRADGGARAWWEQQLQPDGLADDFADQLIGWWPSLSMSPQELWAKEKTGMVRAWGVCRDYERYVLLRRIFTTRQVQEVMTQFWESHLDVPLDGGPYYVFRRAYGDMLRANAFGRYEDILFAAVTHPAMLVHLDNSGSTAGHPFSDADESPDGRTVTRRLVRQLAHHPATARRIVGKLAIRFVSDDAPEALVDELTHVYLTNDTAIVPVLQALIASPEFAASRKKKVRDATEDLVGTWRALGAQVRRPTSAASAANTLPWQADTLGMVPHHSMSGGWWPNAAQGMVYRSPAKWVPELPLRLDQLVDHLSQQLMHQHASTTLVKAACTSVGYPMDTEITEGHPIVPAGIPSLLTTILDSPEFSHR